MRGITTEEEIKEEIENEIVVVNGVLCRHRSQSLDDKEKVLLCSSCQGRGELWISGPYGEKDNEWTNTEFFCLWRDDGSLEILQ